MMLLRSGFLHMIAAAYLLLRGSYELTKLTATLAGSVFLVLCRYATCCLYKLLQSGL